MSHVIAVAGKGGVGKTTLCGLLIQYLGNTWKSPILAVERGKRMWADPGRPCNSTRRGEMIKKNTINLRLKANGYYCDECMKVYAAFEEK